MTLAQSRCITVEYVVVKPTVVKPDTSLVVVILLHKCLVTVPGAAFSAYLILDSV